MKKQPVVPAFPDIGERERHAVIVLLLEKSAKDGSINRDFGRRCGAKRHLSLA